MESKEKADKDVEELDFEQVAELDDVKEVEAHLSEETSYKLMELMGMMKAGSMDEALKEIIERTHLRETNERSDKARIFDYRNQLKDRLNKVEDKLKSMGFLAKTIGRPAYNKLRHKRAKLKARMKEIKKIYRMAEKIE